MRKLVMSIVLTMGLALVLASGSSGAEPAASPGKYTVTAIKAFLYHHATGKFGELDVINGEGVALWNTMIGEGAAGLPSEITLVQVEVSGPNFSQAPGKLAVTATVGKQTLAKQTFLLSDLFSEKGTSVTAPLLLYGTGCVEVTVVASLQGLPGKGKAPELKKTIPFACGE